MDKTDQRLTQAIAIEAAVKTRVDSAVTALYHTAQKAELYIGLSRQYRPINEDGERLPPERQVVRKRALDVLSEAAALLTEAFDSAAARDWGNTTAKADVTVGEETILRDVPVTFLLYLEKRLVDIRALVAAFPTLDPGEVWTLDADAGLSRSDRVETARTAKIPRALITAPATDKHPAQVHVYNEDSIIGYYETVKLSGAVSAQWQRRTVARVERLQKAVKFARERANLEPAPERSVGKPVFDWLFRAEE